MDFVDVMRAAATSVGGGLGTAIAVDLLLIAPVRNRSVINLVDGTASLRAVAEILASVAVDV